MKLPYRWWPAMLAIAPSLLAGVDTSWAAETVPAKPQRLAQQSFATPEAAGQALLAAMRRDESIGIERVLGPGSSRLIRSGDPVADRQGRARFVAAYGEQAKIEPDGEAKATLLIGEKDWPFPFPLVKHAGRWRFDAESGAEEMLNRRIGRNELSAMQVCLAYVDAQREYAMTGGSHNGVHAYAMKFVSAAGKKDGLYWPTAEGEPLSPLGPLVARAKAEGYGKGKNAASEPYHGYLYRILTAQGANAPGGAYDYAVKGKMIGGFALVAYPARWGASGVMTFIVNHDGVVYEKNLGKETAAIATKIKRFDPDASWSKAQP